MSSDQKMAMWMRFGQPLEPVIEVVSQVQVHLPVLVVCGKLEAGLAKLAKNATRPSVMNQG